MNAPAERMEVPTEADTETYANTAKAALEAFTALIADARAGRQKIGRASCRERV